MIMFNSTEHTSIQRFIVTPMFSMAVYGASTATVPSMPTERTYSRI